MYIHIDIEIKIDINICTGATLAPVSLPAAPLASATRLPGFGSEH